MQLATQLPADKKEEGHGIAQKNHRRREKQTYMVCASLLFFGALCVLCDELDLALLLRVANGNWQLASRPERSSPRKDTMDVEGLEIGRSRDREPRHRL
jgi:hypothetical protein